MPLVIWVRGLVPKTGGCLNHCDSPGKKESACKMDLVFFCFKTKERLQEILSGRSPKRWACTV